MWTKIKDDPVFKTIAVFVLGVLAFGFAFNIMFGPHTGGSEHGMGGGYSLDTTLVYILGIVVKLFLIGLVIFVMIAGFRIAKSYLAKGNNQNLNEYFLSHKPKSLAAFMIIAVLLLVIVWSGYQTSNMNIAYGPSGHVQSVGYSATGYAGILLLLVKLLFVLCLFVLVICGVLYLVHRKPIGDSDFKPIEAQAASELNQCSKCGTRGKANHLYCPNCGNKLKDHCENCGTQLNPIWQCCPACGKETITREEDIR